MPQMLTVSVYCLLTFKGQPLYKGQKWLVLPQSFLHST